MKAVRLAVGAFIVLSIVGFFIWLQVTVPVRAQHFVVDNRFKDADCTLGFSWGAPERFTLLRGERIEKTFKSPKVGFSVLRCAGVGWTLETPGHFRLIDGGLAEVTLTTNGEIDVRYEGIGRL